MIHSASVIYIFHKKNVWIIVKLVPIINNALTVQLPEFLVLKTNVFVKADIIKIIIILNACVFFLILLSYIECLSNCLTCSNGLTCDTCYKNQIFDINGLCVCDICYYKINN